MLHKILKKYSQKCYLLIPKIKIKIPNSNLVYSWANIPTFNKNISNILKEKLYAHIAKYKYFFTLQIAQYFNLIRTHFPQMWNQTQNNFSNFKEIMTTKLQIWLNIRHHQTYFTKKYQKMPTKKC